MEGAPSSARPMIAGRNQEADGFYDADYFAAKELQKCSKTAK
jgi:hypothetical protein